MAAAGAAGGPGTSGTDFLTTVFVTRGLSEYQRALQQASTSVLGLATATSGLGQAQYPLFFAFYRSSVGLQILAAQMIPIVGLVRQAREEFLKWEKSMVGLSLTLAHLGIPEARARLVELANTQARTLGIARESTALLSDQLLNLGFGLQQTERFVPLLQAAAIRGHGTAGGAGGAVDPTTMASNLAKAIRLGETAALVNLGIDPARVKNAADRSAALFRELTLTYGNEAAIQMATLQADTNRAFENWRQGLQAIGVATEPVLRAWNSLVNAAGNVAKIWAFGFADLLHLFGLGPPVDRSTFFNKFGTVEAEIDKRTTSFQKRSIDLQQRIADNTNQFNTTLARVLLGGAGAQVRAAATLRNATIAGRGFG